MLEHNIDTGVHMISHNTQTWAPEYRSLIHTVSHRGSSRQAASLHTCMVICALCVVFVLFTRLFVPLLFCCSSSRLSRRPSPRSTRSSCPKTRATSAWGPWSVMTTRHPLTGYEPNRETNFVDTEELDLAATSDIYWQHTFDDTSRNDPDVDDDQLAMYLAGAVDSTGKPVAKRSEIGRFSWDTRNLKSAQSQFPVVSHPKWPVNLGVLSTLESRKSERSLRHRLGQCSTNNEEFSQLNAVKKFFITNSSQHHAEQDRKILHEELRQQQEFRGSSSARSYEASRLQKFQNSESQKTITNLSGRLQELQNEVNLMNDSKDFMDAESTCSGNLHVTSPPGLFPQASSIWRINWDQSSYRSDKMRSRQIFGTHQVFQETFLQIQKLLRQLRILRNWIHLNGIHGEKLPKNQSTNLLAEKKWRTKARLRSEMPVRTVSQKIQFSSVEETLQRIMGQTTNDCRFRIFILTNSLLQLRSCVGR